MTVTHMSHRDASVTPLMCHAVSHVPQRSAPPTRPDPTRPISVVGVVCGVFTSDQIQSDRHLGPLAAPIGFGDGR